MYKAYVVAINNIRKHSNADRLLVGQCFGNNVIVGLDTKDGDLGIYFPTDGQLDEEFARANNLVRLKDPITGSSVAGGGYLDPNKLNIKAINLRQERSDGLFIPLDKVKGITVSGLQRGMSFSEIDGQEICRKYYPKTNKGRGEKSTAKESREKTEREMYPLFKKHIDTPQLAYNLDIFNKGDVCYISLKLHGTSQRTGYLPMYDTKKSLANLIRKALNQSEKLSKTPKWDYVTGSRNVILKDLSEADDNFYRKRAHNLFVDKLHKGETVYYEIVGYTEDGATIMGECDNSKTQDKNFIADYGKKTVFSYGCKQGESQVYIYRMTLTNEDGYVVEYPQDLIKIRAEQMGINCAPEFERFIYTDKEDLIKRVAKFEEGADPIDPSHIREGIIVRREGREVYSPLKQKNFHFKVLEGIIKDSGFLDEEEKATLVFESSDEDIVAQDVE